ncbi:MAG: L,D-transpeptidase family protein [Thiopseudomonas sp.]|jgi:murein L,D-transpeptidase YafK|uniref:L,D-transpeptidase family protein n=1 Tax=Denitrificimonas caeni TaxID=521720 RepID=UPI0003B514E5|nr:L,D-transpeptidase family protein [Denitrificimonas caeni]MBP8008649.1 L,D-transpeptidase family protein [Thiopseudomonas sp.]HHX04511.1 L,D-transpeptidase family protein [Pseudomonas sp.]
MRAMLVALFLSLPILCYASQANSNANPSVDKVLVVKSERALHLMHRGEVVKSYRVSLGKKIGPKEYEGDQRTPEGLYWINWRKQSDNFNLAMHISYPNAKDLQRSKETGLPPGGMIMLHGTPNDEEYPEWFFNTLDWTEGCIALTNSDMQEVWKTVKDGTLIEIRP